VYNIWVFNNTCISSPIKITDMTAEGSGGTSSIGVSNNLCSPTMTNVIAKASGGISNNYAVSNTNDSSPFMTNVTAYAFGPMGTKVGVYNNGSSHPAIRHSLITAAGPAGTFKGIKVTAGTVRVMHSTIIGGVEFPADAMTCFYSDSGFDMYFNFACTELPVP
jgi:hypothetical protein